MHNQYPQLGYHQDHPQMGHHNEYPQLGCPGGQMGGMFDDIKNALQSGWEKASSGIITEAESSWKDLLARVSGATVAAKQSAFDSFFNSPQGKQLVEESKLAYLQHEYQKYKYALWGVGILAVVGIGYLAFRRR